MPTIYRVGHLITDRGLWYTSDGGFDPIIQRLGGANADLPMEFDPELRRDGINWISATEQLPEILNWFSRGDLERWHHTGYRLRAYEVESYRHVTVPYQHIVFARKHIICSHDIDLGALA